MSSKSARQAVLFPDLFAKPLVAKFDAEQVTSDAGVLFLHRQDKKLGFIRKLASCIGDRRTSQKVEHTVENLFRQRILGIACGYSDCNDAEVLRVDPMMKMCAGMSPTSEDRLASQPTLSRLENSVDSMDLQRMQSALASTVVEACRKRYGRKTRRIVIDIDPTDDPTYGAQQLTFFNAFYDNYCYLPLMGFLSFDGHPDQHLFLAMLRAGNSRATLCVPEILTGVIAHLRRRFPKASIFVRLDGAYATEEILGLLDRSARTYYAVNLPKNAVLGRLAAPLMEQARGISARTEETAAVFGETRYAARKWTDGERRVIVKAEVTRIEGREPRDNPRFVVTSLRTKNPERVYDFYRQRGDCENRIKEMKIDLDSGRTSCTRFVANQLRLTFSAAAFVLIQELRANAVGTEIGRATVGTIRCRILKLGARIVESVRRIVIHLPASYPWKTVFIRLAAVNTA